MGVLMPSASSIQRVMECPSSHVLPHVNGSSAAADRGTAIHAFLEHLIGGENSEQALKHVPEEFHDDCIAVEMGKFWSQGYKELQPELSIAADVVAGNARILGKNRAYGDVKEGEVYGTADFIGRTVDGILLVGDFKTGQANVAMPRDNWQLRTLAFIVSRLYREDEVEVCIVKTDGELRIYSHRFDALELGIIEDGLLALHRNLQGAGRVFKEGKHCDWCPAFKSCPAKVGLLRELATAPNLTVEAIVEQLKAGEAKAAYNRFRAIKTAMQKVEAELRMLVEREPIELDDGMAYGPHKTVREELDGKVAFEAVMGLYGADTAKAAVEFSTSKAALERAIAPHCAKGTKAAAVRALVDTIAQNGGVEVSEKTIIKEYRREQD